MRLASFRRLRRALSRPAAIAIAATCFAAALAAAVLLTQQLSADDPDGQDPLAGSSPTAAPSTAAPSEDPSSSPSDTPSQGPPSEEPLAVGPDGLPVGDGRAEDLPPPPELHERLTTTEALQNPEEGTGDVTTLGPSHPSVQLATAIDQDLMLSAVGAESTTEVLALGEPPAAEQGRLGDFSHFLSVMKPSAGEFDAGGDVYFEVVVWPNTDRFVADPDVRDEQFVSGETEPFEIAWSSVEIAGANDAFLDTRAAAAQNLHVLHDGRYIILSSIGGADPHATEVAEQLQAAATQLIESGTLSTS